MIPSKVRRKNIVSAVKKMRYETHGSLPKPKGIASIQSRGNRKRLASHYKSQRSTSSGRANLKASIQKHI